MSSTFGSDIITEGLCMNLDAGDVESYVSGTLWKDTSDFSVTTMSHDVTLDTDCTFSPLHGGCIDFDGSSNGGTFTHPNFGTDSWTIEIWVDPSDNFYNWITFLCATRGFNGYNLGTDGGRDLVYHDMGPEGNSRKLEADEATPSSGIHMHSYTRDSDNGGAMVGYVDGTAVATGTTTIDLSATSGFMARLNNGAEDMNGRIACVRMYKGKAFTQEEVMHNFNALRGRMGV